MTSSGKLLKDLAGGSLGFRTSNALERAMETQRSIDKLTALGAFRGDAISRAARGLYSPEMEKAMAAASSKIAALDPVFKTGSAFAQLKIDALNLPDPFEKFGPMRSALEEADSGFGAEVRRAMDERTDQLVRGGLARRYGERVVFQRGLLDTLRRRELDATGAEIAGRTGLAYRPTSPGDRIAGTCRQRLALASGHFAMIDDGLGFRLVP